MRAETNAKKIRDHLEFLGYEITDLDEETKLSFFARHENKSDFRVISSGSSTVLIARWGSYQKKALRSIDFFTVMNNINKRAISKWYFEEYSEDAITLVIEGIYFDYDKSSFALFVDALETETRDFLPDFNKFRVQQ